MDALAAYGSSSSSSSDDEDEGEAEESSLEQQQHGVVRRVGVGDVLQNDIALVRNQPHVNGNWAGHVYVRLNVPPRSLLRRQAAASVHRLVERLQALGYSGDCLLTDDDSSNSSSSSSSTTQQFFHVSLSRPFYLQAANLEPFLRALTKQVSAAIPPFAVTLASGAESSSPDRHQPFLLLHNDEGTRSFWVWPVVSQQQPPQASLLQQLVRRVDACLAPYRQPPYYDPPLFHVSLASLVPAVPERVARRLLLWSTSNDNSNSSNENEDDDDECENEEDDEQSSSSSSSEEDDGDGTTTQLVTEIHCKFGTTKHYTIPLLQSR